MGVASYIDITPPKFFARSPSKNKPSKFGSIDKK